MNLAPFFFASPLIQIHIIFALLAFFLGGYQLYAKKGGDKHRLRGRVWVLFLAGTALTSFFIRPGGSFAMPFMPFFSYIHLLSLLTLISLFFAIKAAREGKIRFHKIMMLNLYFMALVLTGFFTLAPGRIMHRIFF
jgi:uncharacterized membrane protein